MPDLENGSLMPTMNIKITGASIPKSSDIIDPEAFDRLLKLFSKISWLEYYVYSVIELWNSCENEDQKDLVEELLNRYSYITSAEVRQYGEQIAEKINTSWNTNPSQTLIIAFAENDNADGSQFLLQTIKNKFDPDNGWIDNNFVNNIPKGAYKLKNGNTAILVDDFIGTGKTAKRRFDYLVKILRKNDIMDCKIYILALAAMESAKTVLDTLDIEDYFSCIWLKKGISDSYDDTELSHKIHSMEKLEELLADSAHNNKLHDFNFGYMRSEALYALESYNIPNNVFPIFWWPFFRGGDRRNPIFRRLGK